MRRVPLTIAAFPNKRYVRGFELSAIYAAERDGHFYLMSDDRGLADFLDEEDRADGSLVSVFEFDTAEERQAYAAEHDWVERPPRRSRRPV